MRKKLLFLIVVIFSVNLFSQTAKYPYPIIFLHGLVSSDNTWTQAITALSGSAKVFDVCLDHGGNRATASLTNDISIIGWRDGTSTASPNRLYVMNFDNTRFQTSGHSAHTLSNQSAIYKQGIALKEMIRAVLTIENASKVILIGHSMGGLEIREYLQRGYDGTTNGRGSNWVDQSSSSGHSVAHVVTLGTPHLGSNHSGGILSLILSGIDESSEACRDLRFTTPTTPTAPYLFGGNESAYSWIPQPYNKDVNCNGSQVDLISGLNSGTSFNPAMSLPSNIWYTWITSNYLGRNEDGLVDLSCQWLYSGTTITPQSADTLLLNVHHIDEPNNTAAIIRGIDEPANFNYAYDISISSVIKGFITYGMNHNSYDKDVFKFTATNNGAKDVTVKNTNSGTDSLYVYDGTTLLTGIAIGNGTFSTAIQMSQSKVYYIVITGHATATSWQNPYSVQISPNSGSSIKDNINLNYNFALEQNYPNPFNPETIISYQIPFSGIVTLKLFDILGREAAELVNEEKTAGRYDVKFNGSKLPSGIYIYRLTGNNVNISKKMTLMK